MSYFSRFVLHPALAALSALTSNPAIAASPEAKAAVEAAQKEATAVASTATAAAPAIASAAAAAADPVLKELGAALQAAADAALMSTLGPVGGAIVIPGANTAITLLEQKAHDMLAALFTHAKTQVVAPQPGGSASA